jgi:hypothetical protein
MARSLSSSFKIGRIRRAARSSATFQSAAQRAMMSPVTRVPSEYPSIA